MPTTSSTLDKVINKVGSPYTIYVGSISFDAYGTGSVDFGAGSVATGYVQVLTTDDLSVRAGVLNVGDALGFFKMDASFPAGSKIEINHQGIRFEGLGDVFPPHLSGNQLMKQIALRVKIN